jgi:predicted RNA-binding Zn-ribbon protein involved in translation (DUF1610 family)
MTLLDNALDSLLTGIRDLKSTIDDAKAASIAPRTRSSVVELAALHGSSLFEVYLEELFYVAMLSEHPSSRVRPILTVRSRHDVELLIYMEGQRRERYLDWLPWRRTEERAKAYLYEGRPFDRIWFRNVELRSLEELTVVRNAVAHPGTYAHNKLIELAAARGLTIARPADFLLSSRAGSSEVLLLLTQVEIISMALADASDVVADSRLQPERLFDDKETAPVGQFQCSGCDHEMTAPTPRRLGRCPSCGTVTRCATCGQTFGARTRWRRVSR